MVWPEGGNKVGTFLLSAPFCRSGGEEANKVISNQSRVGSCYVIENGNGKISCLLISTVTGRNPRKHAMEICQQISGCGPIDGNVFVVFCYLNADLRNSGMTVMNVTNEIRSPPLVLAWRKCTVPERYLSGLYKGMDVLRLSHQDPTFLLGSLVASYLPSPPLPPPLVTTLMNRLH